MQKNISFKIHCEHAAVSFKYKLCKCLFASVIVDTFPKSSNSGLMTHVCGRDCMLQSLSGFFIDLYRYGGTFCPFMIYISIYTGCSSSDVVYLEFICNQWYLYIISFIFTLLFKSSFSVSNRSC